MITAAGEPHSPSRMESTWLVSIKDSVLQEPRHDLVLRLTLILLVLHSIQSAPLAAGVRIAAVLMLVAKNLLTNGVLWWSLAAVLIFNNADRWWSIDNHQFLFVYWTLACALTLRSPGALAANARLLVCVAFGFAVVWKVIAGQYFNGSFFYATIMTDPRLSDVAAALWSSASSRGPALDTEMRTLLRDGAIDSRLPIIVETGVHRAALVLSWLGLFGEAAVALLHVTTAKMWYLARHSTLLLFVMVTYWLLPVTGFAFLLAICGLAQVEERDTKLTAIYVAAICAIQLTLVPWTSLLPQGD